MAGYPSIQSLDEHNSEMLPSPVTIHAPNIARDREPSARK